MTHRLSRAWRATIFEAEGIGVLIAPDLRHAAVWRGRKRAAAALLGRLRVPQAAFATAWNPLSRRCRPVPNRRRMARLRTAARRLPQLEGMGRACRPRPWGEEHLLIGAPPGRCAVLARRFRQDSILVIGRFAPARILRLR